MFGVVAGCRSADLFHIQAVPIDGATAEEEAILREEAARIAAYMDVRSVMLTRVVLKDELRSGVWGQYHSGKHTIELDRGYRVVLSEVFRHEVCHAIDDQYGDLSESEEPSLIEAFGVLSGNEEVYPSPQSQRREAFADLCGMGPGPLEALAAEGDAARVPGGVADFVMREAVMELPGNPTVAPLLPSERLGGSDTLLTMYSDGVVGTEPVDGAATFVTVDGEERSGPSEGAEPLELFRDPPLRVMHVFGGTFHVETTADGREVAVSTPRGGAQTGVFVREPGDAWAWLGAAEGDPFVFEWRGEVVFAWSPEPDALRVDVAR